MGRWDDEERPRDRERGSKDSRGTKNDESKSKVRERSRSPVWGAGGDAGRDTKDAEVHTEPLKPDFGLSGLLAAETNTTEQGIVLKHHEPPEKGLPNKKWRLYVFKDGEPLDHPIEIYDRSSYLFGRDRRVADVGTDHGSCSLQHAVIQYRTTDKSGRVAVRPYLMDLKSTNGTFLNGDRLDPERYYELLPKDVITFGSSTREYVILFS